MTTPPQVICSRSTPSDQHSRNTLWETWFWPVNSKATCECYQRRRLSSGVLANFESLALQRRKIETLVFASFHRVNTSTTVDFKLPTWRPGTESWRDAPTHPSHHSSSGRKSSFPLGRNVGKERAAYAPPFPQPSLVFLITSSPQIHISRGSREEWEFAIWKKRHHCLRTCRPFGKKQPCWKVLPPPV